MKGEIELTEQEQALKDKFNLDNEQLIWRRWCIKNNCGGDLNKFRGIPKHRRSLYQQQEIVILTKIYMQGQTNCKA